MSFEEKYNMYKEDADIIDRNKLRTKLENNLKQSLDILYSSININDNIRYFINEVLEDKEHLDAFIASNM